VTASGAASAAAARAPVSATPAAAPPSTADLGKQVKDAAARAGAVLGPAAAKAGAVMAPVAKQAAAKGWAGSVRGMSFLAHVATVGGRAAYSEVFGPLSVAGGQVISAPTTTAVPAPVEPAAIFFVLSFPVGLLILTLPAAGWLILAVFAVLLALSWLGVRRPYFTKMTFTGLAARLRNRGRTPFVPIYRFQVADRATGQPLDVVMIGPRAGDDVVVAATVALWGIRHPDRNELRAWRVENLDAAGLPVGVLTAPRLMPLTVALCLPAVLMLATGVFMLL
jgi:hypothetical protein